MRCAACNDKIKRTQACFGDAGTFYEGKPLCETCYYEDEPCATVFYSKEDTPYIVSHTRDETEGDFKVKWHSTDLWRGYYETSSEKYSLVNTAELLAYHESERMLKDFDQRIRELLEENGIDYARVFARSSNIFFQNYDLYVKKDQALIAQLLVAKAKNEVNYDNPKWYRSIVFDELSLSILVELFPERQIRIDKDAVKLVEELGEDMITEIQERLKNKEIK